MTDLAYIETGEDYTLDEWAASIRLSLYTSVDSLIDAGKCLIEAKRQHPKTFTAWLKTGVIGIGPRRAQQLMKVAEYVTSLPAKHVSCLPVGDTVALYEIATKLEPAELADAIDLGEITPNHGRAQVRGAIAEIRIRNRPRPEPVDLGPGQHKPLLVPATDEASHAQPYLDVMEIVGQIEEALHGVDPKEAAATCAGDLHLSDAVYRCDRVIEWIKIFRVEVAHHLDGEESVVARLTSRPNPSANVSLEEARRLVTEYRRRCKSWSPGEAYAYISGRLERQEAERFRASLNKEAV